MGVEKILFYCFSAVAIGAALMVVTRKNPVQAALFLVLAFAASAGLWLLVEAEFLAIALVLVYVGAVMVLFLFVVMMLDVEIAALKAGFVRYLPVGILVTLILFVEIVLVVGPDRFGLSAFPKPAPLPETFSNVSELGRLLYSVYLYPFEIASVILLVAIIAAIRLTLRRRPGTKFLDPAKQVSVRKGPDRVRILAIPTEPRQPVVRGTAPDGNTE